MPPRGSARVKKVTFSRCGKRMTQGMRWSDRYGRYLFTRDYTKPIKRKRRRR